MSVPGIAGAPTLPAVRWKNLAISACRTPSSRAILAWKLTISSSHSLAHSQSLCITTLFEFPLCLETQAKFDCFIEYDWDIRSDFAMADLTVGCQDALYNLQDLLQCHITGDLDLTRVHF